MENGDVECRINGEWGREMEHGEWDINGELKKGMGRNRV